MSNYERKIDGNFNQDASIKSVLYGSNTALLEDELNETQWHQIENLKSLIKAQYSNGLLNEYTVQTSRDDSTFQIKTKDGEPLKFVLNGEIMKFGYNIPNGLSQNIQPSKDSLILTLPQTESTSRFDIVYLEVWTEIIRYSDKFRIFGGVNTPIIENKMYDDRINRETARRVQTRWRVTVGKGKTEIAGLNATRYDGDITQNVPYVKSNDIYVANFGPQYFEDNGFKTSGEVIAIPLFKVYRKINNDTIDADNIEHVVTKALSKRTQNIFEDLGNSQLGLDGRISIPLSADFINNVKTSTKDYVVTIQGIDGTDFIVSTRGNTSFMVEGTPGKKFMYRVIGYRK